LRASSLLLLSFLLVLSSFGCGKNDSPSTQSFCRSISELQLNDALSLDISANDDAKVRLAIRQTANLMTKVLEETPNNNQKDAAIISAFINALADAVSNSDFDSPLERAAALSAVQQAFAASLYPAVDKFNAYTARACSPGPKA
jgi:hypothetical protein